MTIAPSWSCLVLVMPCPAIAYTNRVNLPELIRLTVGSAAVQVEMIDEALQSLAGVLGAQGDLARETEVGQPGVLADQQHDVLAVRALFTLEQQAPEGRVRDQVFPVVENIFANLCGLEQFAEVHAELAHDLR